MEQITKNDIEHLGRIISLNNEKVTVSIVSQAGCVSCSVKGNCSVGDVEEKIVEVANTDDRNIKIGDIVFYVSGSSRSILKAERLVLNSMRASFRSTVGDWRV